MKFKINYKAIKDYLGMTFGAVIFAVAYSWFLIPYKMTPGGVGGLGQIFYHFFGVPVGLFMILINIPLFIIGIIFIGKSFGAKTFFGMFITSSFTDLLSLQSLAKVGIIKDLSKYTHHVGTSEIIAFLPPSDIMLSAITGAVLLGMALGIIFRFRGSTGGTDIPVALIQHKTGASIGKGYWIVESFIIFTVGFVFRDPKIIIFGYINLFISSKIADLTSEGLPYVKGVFIMSKKTELIKNLIIKEIARGVTIFKGKGGYSGEDQDILFCVLSRNQVSRLIDIVKMNDPSAFFILTDVSDVMGDGFKMRKLELGNKKVEKKNDV